MREREYMRGYVRRICKRGYVREGYMIQYCTGCVRADI